MFSAKLVLVLLIICVALQARAETYRAECLISYRALEDCAPFTGCEFGANVVWFSFADSETGVDGIHPQWSEEPEESLQNVYLAVRNNIVGKVRQEKEEQNCYIFDNVKSYNFSKSKTEEPKYLAH